MVPAPIMTAQATGEMPREAEHGQAQTSSGHAGGGTGAHGALHSGTDDEGNKEAGEAGRRPRCHRAG